MLTALKKYNGDRVLVFVMGAFGEMSGDVSRICDIIAHELARIYVSYHNDDAKRAKGMYRQRIPKAWGHTAHRGRARLLLGRTWDLIIHGTAHRGANGAAMPTDKDEHDGNFLFSHLEREGTLLPPRRAQPLLSLPRSNPPPEGGHEKDRRAKPMLSLP